MKYKILTKWRENYLFGVLVLLYLLSRCLYLDSDPPIWAVSYYCIIDELYYTPYAFDLVYGVGGLDIEKNSPLLNFLQQISTAPFLFFFGNNYYGLRLPSVAAGFFVLLFFYLLVSSRFGRKVAFLFSLLLIFEFSFTLATRIAEPTIFRLAAISGLLHLCTKISAKARGWELSSLGFMAGCSWFFVYFTNAFAVLASLLVVVLLCRNNLLRSLCFFCCGAVLALILYGFSIFMLGSSPQEVLSIVSLGSSKVAGLRESGTFASVVVENLEAFLRANFIARNPIFSWFLVFFFGWFLLSWFWRPVVNGNLKKNDVIVLIFLFAFLLQSLFVNDYPERKLVLIFPLVLYSFFILLYWPHVTSDSVILEAVRYVVVLIVFLSFSIATYFNVYDGVKYKYKSAMMELASLGGVNFVGGWSHAFRLYSEIKPYLNKYVLIYRRSVEYYEIMKSHSDAGLSIYTIEYDNAVVDKLSDIGFYKKKLLLKSDDSSYPDIYLFKKEIGVSNKTPHQRLDF